MLQSGSQDDDRAFTYVAQHQPHLGFIQISLNVSLARTRTADRLLIFTDGNDDTVAHLEFENFSSDLKVVTSHERGEAFTFKLPASSEKQTLRINVDAFKRTYDFKLSSKRSTTTSIPPGPPLSANELSEFRPTRICCSACHRSLALLSADEKGAGPLFRPLPSPHYQELIEAYLCHPSGEFAKKMDDVGEKGFWPDRVITQEGIREVVLVGETELRLDARLAEDNWLASSLNISTIALSMSRWTDITCECGDIVGEVNRHVGPSEEDAAAVRQTLKLWKHSIRLDRSDGAVLAYDPEVFVMAEMLSLAQAHSTRRFTLYETGQEESEPPRVMLWLFQPEMAIASGSASRPGSIAGMKRDVAKILYSFPLESLSDVPGQRETLQTESLSYPAGIIDKVIRALKSSTELLPDGQRRMGGHEIGFLARR